MTDRPAMWDGMAGGYAAHRASAAEQQTWHQRLLTFADAPGRDLLDVGCGPGALLVHARRAGWNVRGCDASREMVALARAANLGSTILHCPAEDLRFHSASADLITMSLVWHLCDQAPAIAQARRVLRPGGVLAILTFDPSNFDGFWLCDLVPGYRDLEQRRFPAAEHHLGVLAVAGFSPVSSDRISSTETLTRDEAVARLAARSVSTLRLLPDEAIQHGLSRARELPDEFEVPARFVLLRAVNDTVG